MKIAVLGGGHGSYAAAADLSEQGHEVRLWRRDAAALKPVLDSGAIKVTDIRGSRAIPIARPTADIAEAVRDARLVLIPAPATAQDDIARAMAPHLDDGQVVFLPPGTFGSYVMSADRARGRHRAPRSPGPRPARCPTSRASTASARYDHHPRSAPARPASIRRERAEHALRGDPRRPTRRCSLRDALSGALMNAGPIIHPPLILMNAAPLQHFERWDIHNEGTQPSVRAVTDRLDLERIAVREALGYDAPHFPLADHYTSDRWMYGDAHKRLVESGDWREHIDLHTHRYMTEDTELGLAFLASVARWAGVDAPLAHGLLAIVGGILGRDLRHGPRTLEALGLAGLVARTSCEQLLHDGAA